MEGKVKEITAIMFTKSTRSVKVLGGEVKAASLPKAYNIYI